MFGLGAAWYEREHIGLGVPYPPTAERFERLEATLQICKQMWSPNNGRYDSKHYQLAERLCSRTGAAARPPILIGGTGERKTLRLVAEYADAWNGSFGAAEEAEQKLGVLHRHGEAVERDPAEILKTVMLLVDRWPTSTDPHDRREYARLGFDLMDVIQPVDETDPAAYASGESEHVYSGWVK